MSLLNMFTLMLGCQLVGELAVRLTQAPLPGPVVGMLLLLAGLLWWGRVPEPLHRTSQFLLAHLSLLFVPAGAGVLLHLGRIQTEWLALLGALVVSTVASLLVTALVMRWLIARLGGAPDDGEDAHEHGDGHER